MTVSKQLDFSEYENVLVKLASFIRPSNIPGYSLFTISPILSALTARLGKLRARNYALVTTAYH